MQRTMSIEERNSANAEISNTLLRTKSGTQKENALHYANQLAAQSTAALSTLSFAQSDLESVAMVNFTVPVDIGLANENYAMMAEEQAVMDRCEFLNNGCSDYCPDPTRLVKGKDTYADWVSAHDQAVKETKAGHVPTHAPKNNNFGPLLTESEIASNMSIYHDFKNSRERYNRWEHALGCKMAATELAIESKYAVLNNGCSYGGVDLLHGAAQ